MIIRKYKKEDKKALEQIHFDTGFFGDSMKEIIDNVDLYSLKMDYFLDRNPDSIIVAEENKKVCGYLIACKNYSLVRDGLYIIWKIIFKIGNIFKLTKRDTVYWWDQFKNVLRSILGFSNEDHLKMPREDFYYIHMNVHYDFRGQGIGKKLLDSLEAMAKREKINNICAVAFDRRHDLRKGDFWRKNGFEEYSRIKTGF